MYNVLTCVSPLAESCVPAVDRALRRSNGNAPRGVEPEASGAKLNPQGFLHDDNGIGSLSRDRPREIRVGNHLGN